jgi:hypothetical protein
MYNVIKKDCIMIASTDQCPRCAGYLLRIRRRRIDRLMSIFKPVQRYQCQHYSCRWKGNIRVKYNGAPSLTKRQRNVRNASKEDVSFSI